MRKILVLSAGLLALVSCSPKAAEPAAPKVEAAVAAPESCIPAGKTRADLGALKAAGFEIADDTERQAFARTITACLGSPDPGLRDGIAYEALTHMLRGKQL